MAKAAGAAAITRTCAIAGLILAGLADLALAQKADRPHVKAGDQWQFAVYYSVPSNQPNCTWVITSVTSVGIEGTENGEPLTLTPELNIQESPQQTDSNPQALSFPLEVGKRWRYATDWVFKPKGSRGSSIVEVAIVAYEKVKVPAGEFDAFRLVSKRSLRGTSPINSQYAGEITTTYWYAPAARAIIRSVSHNPYLGPTTIEMVGFELQP
jgi:hypothetical protein